MNQSKKYLPLLGSLFISLLFPFFALFGDAHINGKVVDSASVSPLKGVKVFLLKGSSEEIVQEARTDAKGGYEFKHVSSGKYHVKVEHSDYVAVSTHPIALSVEDLPVRANFSLGIPGGIMGQVVDDATNLPIAHAHVDVMRGNNIVVSVVTDENGYYKVDGLAPRPYIVRVRMTYFQSSMQLAVPVSNQIFRVDFSLKFPPGKLLGQIFDCVTGEPIGNATVDILNNEFIIDSVQSSEDGSYAISEITAGTYHVKIRAEKYGTMFQQFSLLPNESLTAHFAIEPLGAVEGYITHHFTGEPIVKASIGMWQNDALFASTHSDENGYFRLSGLGDSQIVVQALHFCDKEFSVRILPAQATQLSADLIGREPAPPKKVVVWVSYKYFAHQVNRIHTVKWKASVDPTVVAYRIYRDGKFVVEVSADDQLMYKDRWRSGRERKYAVTAVNQFGQESSAVRNNGVLQ